jgi:hypothetical protein
LIIKQQPSLKISRINFQRTSSKDDFPKQ